MISQSFASSAAAQADDNLQESWDGDFNWRQKGSQQESPSKGELHVTNVAIVVNFILLIAKLVCWWISGSSSILAEALHSLADTVNQFLLRIGLLQSLAPPDTQFPYGRGRDKFIWSLISAVSVFCIGAGVSIIHGVQGLFSPERHQLENLSYGLGVLVVSFVLEGASWYVAARQLMRQAKAAGVTTQTYIRQNVEPTTNAVFVEDTVSLLGCLIASAFTGLAYHTGNQMFDSFGAILVGGLLALMSIQLIKMNRGVLLGHAIPGEVKQKIKKYLCDHPIIYKLKDTRTEIIGSGNQYRFKAEVEFNGEEIARRHMQRMTPKERSQILYQMRLAIEADKPQAATEQFLKKFGGDIVDSLGAEIDSIEEQIQEIYPNVTWFVDLETDKGKYRRQTQTNPYLAKELIQKQLHSERQRKVFTDKLPSIKQNGNQ